MIPDGRVVVGRGGVNGGSVGIYKPDGTLTWHHGGHGDVQAVGYANGQVIVGGHFSSIGGGPNEPRRARTSLGSSPLQPGRRSARHNVAALARQREGRLVDPRNVERALRRRRLRDDEPRRDSVPSLRAVPGDLIVRVRSAKRLSSAVPLACLALLGERVAGVGEHLLDAAPGEVGDEWARLGDPPSGERRLLRRRVLLADPVDARAGPAAGAQPRRGRRLHRRPAAWAPDVDGPVYSLASNGRSVFVGGSFGTGPNGSPRDSFAAIALNGTLRP